MVILALLLILVVACGAFAAAPRLRVCLRWTVLAGMVVAALGLYLLFWAARDYMTRFPRTATVLHPWLVAWYVALSSVLGIFLGLIARSTHDRWRRGHASVRGR